MSSENMCSKLICYNCPMTTGEKNNQKLTKFSVSLKIRILDKLFDQTNETSV